MGDTRTNTVNNITKSNYQLLDPSRRIIRSLVSEGKGPFRYHRGYNLMSQRAGTYTTGTLLVEWYHSTDRYVVQAVNVPYGNKSYGTAWAAYSKLGHEVHAPTSMLLMFEIRQSKTDTSNIFNCRVRHVPTKIQFFDWDNFRLPRFTIVRKGHEQEMKEFLGDRLKLDGTDGGSSYEGELLDRFEHGKAVSIYGDINKTITS